MACTIATELDLVEYKKACEGAAARRPPKPIKKLPPRGGMLGRTSSSKPRKTTKNADHQTVPRFEQLVDLGFLTKPYEGERSNESGVLAGRRRWRYVPTEACRRWAEARRLPRTATEPFKWHHFAHAAVSAFKPQAMKGRLGQDPNALASYLWRAYERVGRPMGTPLSTVSRFSEC